MFKYDSVHGHFKGEVKGDKSGFFINGRQIHVYGARDPKASPCLNHEDYGVGAQHDWCST